MYLLKLLSLASSPTPVVPGGLQGCLTFPPQSFVQLVFAKINFPPAMRGSCEGPGLFPDCFNLTMRQRSLRNFAVRLLQNSAGCVIVASAQWTSGALSAEGTRGGT